MARIVDGRQEKVYLPPGTLMYVGEPTDARDRIRIIEYNAQTFREREVQQAGQVRLAGEPAAAPAPTPLSAPTPPPAQMQVEASVKAMADGLDRARSDAVVHAATGPPPVPDLDIAEAPAPDVGAAPGAKDPIDTLAAGNETHADTIRWITVCGVHNPKLIQQIGAKLGLHDMTLETVMDTSQRPKIDHLGDSVFVLLKRLIFDPAARRLERDEVCLLMGKNLVVTFKEHGDDIFEPIRERIRKDHGRIRQMGADYLMYSILDFLIDGYFLAFEQMDAELDRLEDSLTGRAGEADLHVIHRLRREAILFRKTIWPLRDVVTVLAGGDSDLIAPDTEVFFRALRDHTVQVIEASESIREALSGLLDLYLTGVSNRTNTVMKVLTVIATIFIPLSFLAGIYGMNVPLPFQNSQAGFWLMLAIMVAVALVMLAAFRKRKWI